MSFTAAGQEKDHHLGCTVSSEVLHNFHAKKLIHAPESLPVNVPVFFNMFKVLPSHQTI